MEIRELLSTYASPEMILLSFLVQHFKTLEEAKSWYSWTMGQKILDLMACS